MSDHDHQLDHQLDRPVHPLIRRAAGRDLDALDLEEYLDSEIDVDLESDGWAASAGTRGEAWGDDPWVPAHGDPAHRGTTSSRRRVTHLVLVDGLPADHWVDDSAEGGWGRGVVPPRGRGPRSEALEPPHLRELRWLDSLVGGRNALMALDTAGLVAPPKLSLPATLTDPGHAARAEEIRVACAHHAATVFHDAEMPAATHHTLEAVLRADPAFLARSARDDTAAGAIVWIAGHANGHIGPTGDLLARDLWKRIEVSSSAAARGSTMLHRLRSAHGSYVAGPWGDEAPPGAPRLKATGHPSLLTCATRTVIAARRDAALAAASF